MNRGVLAVPSFGFHPHIEHSSVVMTLDRYGHLLEGLDADIAGRLEGLRSSSRGFSADSFERTDGEATERKPRKGR